VVLKGSLDVLSGLREHKNELRGTEISDGDLRDC
jgi:hypothetical protein